MKVDPARESGCTLMSSETPPQQQQPTDPAPQQPPSPSAIVPAPTPSPSADPGLPPVLPPSGKQMLQLFVVPALIIAVLVGLYLMGSKLSGWLNPGKSAEQFLRDLDSDNEEVRYRAASDLAQMLPRKEKRAEELARDVDLCLGLADRLAATLDNSADAEKGFAERHARWRIEHPKEAKAEDEGKQLPEWSEKKHALDRDLKALDRDRNLVTYLAA